MEQINILLIGDVVGKPGRKACRSLVTNLRDEHELDLVIANGENLASGSSITKETITELFSAGVDVITSGDHIFRKKESYKVIEENPAILRPLNYPRGAPGAGFQIVTTSKGHKVAVVNLMGRVFMQPIDCPFQAMETLVGQLHRQTRNIIVDFHAEATSEKVAMGWFLDGQVSAVCGTHTHIQTADEAILPRGTAYITEVGMTGPYRSVIGRNIEQVLYKFRTQLPSPMDVATEDVRLSGVLISIDPANGKAISIKRLHQTLNGNAE